MNGAPPTGGSRVLSARSLAEMHALFVRAARHDPNRFAQLVLRDEQSFKHVTQARHHVEFQRIWSEHRESVIVAHPESGKTNQAVARALWMLGRNPRLKVLFISKTIGAAEERLKLARQYIEDSAGLHAAFPHLRLDKRGRNHSRALTVEREGAYAIKDASIKAVGLNGNVLGSRVDFIILDDWVDFLIARTEAPRRAALAWFRSNNCYGRLTAIGRVAILTNAWHPKDPNEVLGSPPPDGSGFYLKRFPSLDALGRPTYEERWPLERLDRVRVAMGSAEFSRAHLCLPQEAGSQACKPEWLEKCERRGLGMPLFSSLQTYLDDDRSQPGEYRLALAYRDALAPKHAGARPSFGRAVAAAQDLMEEERGRDGMPLAVLHGVDSAFQVHNAADLSAIVTVAVYRNGHKKLLRVVSGRWDIVELVRQITLAWCAFGGTFVVENNGGAEHVLTLVRYETPVPVVGFLTGTNKFKPGTGIHTLFAAFEAGQWVIPSQPAVVQDEVEEDVYEPRDTGFLTLAPEVAALADECLTYDPLSHTGDRLMAAWFVQRYAVRLFGGVEQDIDERAPEVSEIHVDVPESVELPPEPPRRVLPPGMLSRLR